MNERDVFTDFLCPDCGGKRGIVWGKANPSEGTGKDFPFLVCPVCQRVGRAIAGEFTATIDHRIAPHTSKGKNMNLWKRILYTLCGFLWWAELGHWPWNVNWGLYELFWRRDWRKKRDYERKHNAMRQ